MATHHASHAYPNVISRATQNFHIHSRTHLTQHSHHTNRILSLAQDILHLPHSQLRISSSGSRSINPTYPRYHSNTTTDMSRRPPGRGDKRAGGKRPPKTREESISRNLSYLLRHNAAAEGVHVDDGGWAIVADVVGLVDLVFSKLHHSL